MSGISFSKCSRFYVIFETKIKVGEKAFGAHLLRCLKFYVHFNNGTKYGEEAFSF